ncbi:MAG: hypothetical protein ACYS8I_13495 [Planctomycetota bacterium]|jgi:hypothetical protein
MKKAGDMDTARPNRCTFSIVIPVLNEQERINSTIGHLRSRTAFPALPTIGPEGHRKIRKGHIHGRCLTGVLAICAISGYL